ncbi:MAG TPA: hypothetical protein VGP48_14885 [Stellaceae bacterium]|jgi:hypothetical protein|nr:hypothetical protein [Stellaceae bacterium]
MRRHRIGCAIAAAIWLAGCTAPFDVPPSADNESAYSALYPLYAELCAVSQIKKKPGFGVDTSGGPGGHAVFYLNGVCRDRDSGYPTLVMCGAGVPADEQGVGVSVNAHFQNANWVATDGRAFFFDGDLQPGAPLTRAAYAQTQKTAEAKGIYDGIVFHPEVFDAMPAGMDRRDFMYEVSVATDYAVAFARDRYCARVPVTPAQMTKIVDYLNQVNAIYRDGKKEFVWNVVQNNCSHLAHNALAAAGVWDAWPTDRFIAISAFDFPVPKNEFVNLMRRTNDMDVADPRSLYRDDAARQSLVEDAALPTTPGALAEAVPMVQDNAIYDTSVNLIFYDEPVTARYSRHFHQIFAAPRYTDLRANLDYFAALYRQIRSERANAPPAAAQAPDDFRRFLALYDAYIDREARSVDAKIETLDRLPALAAATVGGIRP